MHDANRIITALFLAVLAGVCYALWSVSSNHPPHGSAEKEVVEARALSARLAEALKKDALNDRERHLLQRAATEWPKDPFAGKRRASSRHTAGAEPASPVSAYRYSGYMEVDKMRLAIINGMQYQVGDHLEYGRFVIRSIEAQKVVVEDLGNRERLILPFFGGGGRP